MRAPAPAAPILVCEGVRRRFGRFEALRGVSLTVRRGEVVCIVGPSGSGKSTFLRTINALEPLDEGRIEVDGITLPATAKDVLAVRRNTGMGFQSFNQFPHLTVRRLPPRRPQIVCGARRRDRHG